MPKRLWRGVFRFPHKIVVRYLRAYSEKQAKVLMMRRIAKEQEVPYSYVFGLFFNDNYTISEDDKNGEHQVSEDRA